MKISSRDAECVSIMYFHSDYWSPKSHSQWIEDYHRRKLENKINKFNKQNIVLESENNTLNVHWLEAIGLWETSIIFTAGNFPDR